MYFVELKRSFNNGEASTFCRAAGAVLATTDQLIQAQGLGADWCAYGHTVDSVSYPITTSLISDCGLCFLN